MGLYPEKYIGRKHGTYLDWKSFYRFEQSAFDEHEHKNPGHQIRTTFFQILCNERRPFQQAYKEAIFIQNI